MSSLDRLRTKAADGEPITMVTAYDAAMARLVDRSDVDAILVGDSVGVTMLGYDRTDRVTVDELVHHAGAVTRVVEETPVVVDLPFGAYNAAPADAVRNANRLKKEGGADAVKLEGGREVVDAVDAITTGGVPVVGHIGVTPQTADATGGYAVQGATAGEADALVDDATALENAGAVGLVLELVDGDAARAVTDATSGPTIGIGAGPDCDGQVVTLHDLLGLQDVLPETAAGVRGSFGEDIVAWLDRYHDAVSEGEFPERVADGRE